MTKAQKENQARFKKVQAEAKKLKAKNPKLKHIDAVKKAWAIVSPGSAKKKAPVKKAPVKKVGAVKKKAPVKKAPVKKAPARSYHKDTKSHNVKISVMSGVNPRLSKYLNDIQKASYSLNKNAEDISKYKAIVKTKQPKANLVYYNKMLKGFILYDKELKEHIKQLKKLI